MGLSFRAKLLASHVGLVIAAGAIGLLGLNQWLSDDLVRQLDERLEEQARGAIEWAHEGGRRHPEKVATRIANIVDAEVTLFDKDGTVLGASSPAARSDVGDEVEAARRGVVGRTSRRRAGEELHYVAVPSPDGIVIRLAVPLSDVNGTVDAMQRRLLVASAVAVAVAIALGILASRIASRPLGQMTRTATRLAQGDFDVPIETSGRDEFGVLWRALGSLAEQLEARIGELVAERDQLSAILAGMVEGVLVLDREGRVLVANPAARKILGAERDLVGAMLDDAVPEEETRELIERCLRGESTGAELEVVDRRGAAVVVYVRPLSRGTEGAVVAVLRDMTALRRLGTVRRDFVANVSHELRTPVTAIQGYAETLLRGTTDGETGRQFLEIIHRQAQRIGGLVEQLLSLSDLEARSTEDTVRSPVAIGPLARHVAEAMRGRASARGTAIELDVGDGVRALADAEGLERALLNLVDNAVKYGRENGHVRLAATGDDAKVVVVVTDDGPGIPDEHLGRVFERFYRVDPGRSRRHGGAGLGLSIAKHLVEAMGGTVEVTSREGRGTTFAITLSAAADVAG